MALLFWLALTVICCWIYIRTRKPAHFPPGPVRLPVVGTLWKSHRGAGPSFIKHQKMAQQYGKVVGYYFFNQPAVMVFDSHLGRQLFSTEESTGRPHLDVMLRRTFGKLRGLLFGEGAEWQRQRRFTLRHLRDLGMGRSSLEEIIQHELQHLRQRLQQSAGRPLPVRDLFNVHMVNMPWQIVAGSRLTEQDRRLPIILEGSSDLSSQSSGLAGLLRILFGHLLSDTFASRLYRGMEKNRDQLIAIFKTEIDQHMKTLDETAPRDFIDLYLIERSKDAESAKHFDDLSLYAVLTDLFTGSVGTNSLTMEWALLFLLLHPEVQHRARAEIRQAVGGAGDRPVLLADMPQLPYTQALVAEVLRRSSVLPLALPHRAEAAISLGEYRIPAGCWLYVNQYAVHHDPQYWDEPLQFRPERFLRDGEYRSDRNLIPFGVGRRACLGESLARWQQFLMLANIVHRFEVTAAPGETPRFQYQTGARSAPAPFSAVFTPLTREA